MYGIIETDTNGLIKCEICGLHFARVACHVNKVHGMSAKEYKIKFGFVRSAGLCSVKSREYTSENSKERYKAGEMQSFISNSTKGRFRKGGFGRTSHMISPQAKIQQTERMKMINFRTYKKQENE